MADLMKQETLEAAEMFTPKVEAAEAITHEDSDELYIDDEDMMVGKYECPPTRRALTHEEFEDLLEFLRQPPKPLTPEAKRMIENYKRIKARLV